MWRSRGRVPVAVDSTATFVELLLEAGPGTTPTDGALNASKDHAYRLQLALALIRYDKRGQEETSSCMT